MKRSNSLKSIIEIAIQIDNRQYEKYVNKKIKIKIHSAKRFLKGNSMNLNIIKIKKLRIKTCYTCEKKNYLKRYCL